MSWQHHQLEIDVVIMVIHVPIRVKSGQQMLGELQSYSWGFVLLQSLSKYWKIIVVLQDRHRGQ